MMFALADAAGYEMLCMGSRECFMSKQKTAAAKVAAAG